MQTSKQIQQEAERASALIKATAEATALALAKANSETIDLKLKYIQQGIDRVEDNFKSLTAKDGTFVLKENFKPENFASKEEFVFWRNVLISGLVVTIALGVILKLITP